MCPVWTFQGSDPSFQGSDPSKLLISKEILVLFPLQTDLRQAIWASKWPH